MLSEILSRNGTEKISAIRRELQEAMMDKCGIFRDEKGLGEMKETINELKERYNNISVQDKGEVFNTDLIESIELKSLLDIADTIALSAYNRTESRGAHSREDFPKRDDKKWMKHTLIWKAKDGKDNKIDYKKVKVTQFQPKERKY